jgi:hypothetical protein
MGNESTKEILDRKTQMHAEICASMTELYGRKNHDYCDSFARVRDEDKTAIIVRLFDKYHRLKTLIRGEAAQVKEESIDDTLKDLANYCIMELIERSIEKTARIQKETQDRYDIRQYVGEKGKTWEPGEPVFQAGSTAPVGYIPDDRNKWDKDMIKAVADGIEEKLNGPRPTGGLTSAVTVAQARAKYKTINDAAIDDPAHQVPKPTRQPGGEF